MLIKLAALKGLNKQHLKQVVAALNNPNYKWRTIEGITKETGLSRATVIVAINRMKDNIVTSRNTDPEGNTLITTKENFKKHATAKERIIAAFSNRSR